MYFQKICILAYLTLSSAFYSATIFSHSTIYIYGSAFTPWGPRKNCKYINLFSFQQSCIYTTYLMVHLLIVEPSSKDISSNLNFMWRGSPRWIMILSVLTSSWVAIKGIKTQNITLVILMIDDSTSSLSSLCLKQTVIVYKLSVLIKRWSSNFWKTWHGIMNYIDNWSAIEIFCYETWYLRYLLLLNS